MRAVILFLLAGLLLASGCKRHTDWRATLSHRDKNPYGTYLAYETLRDFFEVGTITPLPALGVDSTLEQADSGNILILICRSLNLDQEERNALLEFARNGNQVLIATADLDNDFAGLFGLNAHTAYREQPNTEREYNPDPKEALKALYFNSDTTRRYGMPGRAISSAFEASEDTDVLATPEVLGSSRRGADFVRCDVGAGQIFLHKAPLAFSNYFLLQPGNREYLQQVWQYMNRRPQTIFWAEGVDPQPMRSQSLLRYPSIRNSFLIALAALLLYFLLEGRRKQRMIPVIPPKENSSADFARTVGLLYFNQGDHRNLAEKMIQHFLESVASRYRTRNILLNDDLARMLAARSGQSLASARELTDLMLRIRSGSLSVDQHTLLILYRLIQMFKPETND